MIKLVFGVKGTGKTKIMLDTANETMANAKGDVVYIDRDMNHIHDLSKGIRLIESGEFQIDNLKAFYGFLCGIISQNFDIETIFIDGQKIIGQAVEKDLDDFVVDLQKLEYKFNVSFYVSCSRAIETVSEFVKKFTY